MVCKCQAWKVSLWKKTWHHNLLLQNFLHNFVSALYPQVNQYDHQMRLEIMNYIGRCRVRSHESVDVGGNVFGVVDDFAAKLRRRHPLRFADDETLFHQNAAG